MLVREWGSIASLVLVAFPLIAQISRESPCGDTCVRLRKEKAISPVLPVNFLEVS